MKKTIFTGAGVAIVTPMNADGSIDFETFGKLIDFQIDNGTDCIVVCGTTGESSTMTDDEHKESIRYCSPLRIRWMRMQVRRLMLLSLLQL